MRPKLDFFGQVDRAAKTPPDALARPTHASKHTSVKFRRHGEPASGFERAGRLLRDGKPMAAIAILEHGDLLTWWVPSMILYAEALRLVGERDVSRSWFKRATKRDPRNAEAWYGLGLLSAQADRDEAIRCYRRALRSDSRLGAAHRELGFLFWRQGRTLAAEGELRLAIKINPRDPWARNYYGHLLHCRGLLRRAEAAFRYALAIWKQRAHFHTALADCLLDQGRNSEARSSFRRALVLEPENKVANRQYGLALLRLGDKKRARPYLERTLAQDPRDHRAIEALALVNAH